MELVFHLFGFLLIHYSWIQSHIILVKYTILRVSKKYCGSSIGILFATCVYLYVGESVHSLIQLKISILYH